MENKELEALKEKYAVFIASLSDEDKAKVEACRTVGELTALAQNSDGELPDEIAEAVAGGKDTRRKCPHCGSTDLEMTYYPSGGIMMMSAANVRCRTCGYNGSPACF
ncbi:MAG: hypothetical protein IK093_05600 [Ruminiclostridium sp.]|nr:hypothetical protein [Ruminiclostridium sp.]